MDSCERTKQSQAAKRYDVRVKCKLEKLTEKFLNYFYVQVYKFKWVFLLLSVSSNKFSGFTSMHRRIVFTVKAT